MVKGSVRTDVLTRSHPQGEMRVPVCEVIGVEDGPTLTITAGTHGAEYAGIDAAVKLFRGTDPKQLKGRLRVIPVCNVPGYLARREVVCPVDNVNLNRVFPGNPKGSYTEALADLIFTEVLTGSDFVIDMHGGDIYEALVPYTGVSACPSVETFAASQELGRLYGLPYLLEFKSLPGGGGGVSLAASCRNAGIPGLLAEAGGEGVLVNDEMLLHVHGVRNVMRKYGMIPGESEFDNGVREGKTEFWSISEEGMVYPTLKLFQHVMPGDPMGVVTDWFGNVIEQLTAPREAHVIAIVTTLAARKDAIVYQVAVD